MTIQERYLTSVDLLTVPSLVTDILVIGSGVAGLTAALAAADTGAAVLLVSKDELPESNSYYAQGGVAVALAEGDSPESHLEDTLVSGVGLCDVEAVRVLVTEGRERCLELIDWGAAFDRNDEGLSFTMEGAHSQRRVIHGKDATGKVIVETLIAKVREHESITLLAHHFTIDLLHHEGGCYGALTLDTVYGRLLRVRAGATILAAGGLGQIYRETTNPDVATGDGYALGYRAGATLCDMEFVQFHPTTLYLPGAPRFLISEAVRGEGATLLDINGERFMEAIHPLAELAPRDVVSQAIFDVINTTGGTYVNLDLRHLSPEVVAQRFPTILQVFSSFGLDPTRDLIPVRPACHYMMGGVKVDLNGATNIERLYAAGEVASSGVHGANRLASNSLLEALVFGYRAGQQAVIDKQAHKLSRLPIQRIKRRLVARPGTLDIDDLILSLKALAWRDVGVFRTGQTLAQSEGTLAGWEQYVLPEQFHGRRGFEMQNSLTVLGLIIRSARQRTESRGAHQRRDYPATDPAWERHIEMQVNAVESA